MNQALGCALSISSPHGPSRDACVAHWRSRSPNDGLRPAKQLLGSTWRERVAPEQSGKDGGTCESNRHKSVHIHCHFLPWVSAGAGSSSMSFRASKATSCTPSGFLNVKA